MRATLEISKSVKVDQNLWMILKNMLKKFTNGPIRKKIKSKLKLDDLRTNVPLVGSSTDNKIDYENAETDSLTKAS